MSAVDGTSVLRLSKRLDSMEGVEVLGKERKRLVLSCALLWRIQPSGFQDCVVGDGLFRKARSPLEIITDRL